MLLFADPRMDSKQRIYYNSIHSAGERPKKIDINIIWNDRKYK